MAKATKKTTTSKTRAAAKKTRPAAAKSKPTLKPGAEPVRATVAGYSVKRPGKMAVEQHVKVTLKPKPARQKVSWSVQKRGTVTH